MLPPPPAAIDRFSTIWAVIEAHQSFPALFVVASATETDDTESVARGLCRAARAAGKRIGYLYMGRIWRNPSNDSSEYSDISIAGREPERERIDSWLNAWRNTFDVVIVELPDLAACSQGAHLARLATGVIIALHAERAVLKADRDLTTLLAQLGSSTIGVVKTAVVKSTALAVVDKKRAFGSLFPIRQR